MMPTNARLDGLRQRFVALRTRFDEVGARAAAAAPGLTASVVPDEALLEDLRATTTDFDGLRLAIVDEFAGFPNTPDPAALTTLKALEVVLSVMEHLQAEQARRAAWEAARDEALGVLERVNGLAHREESDFAALAECQAQARELHAALADAPSGDAEQLAAHLRPFVELMTLAQGWNRLEDDECVALEDAIAQNFGRPLGLAALRGKLGQQSELPAYEPDAGLPDAEALTAEAEPFSVEAEPVAMEPEPVAMEPEPLSLRPEPELQAPDPAIELEAAEVDAASELVADAPLQAPAEARFVAPAETPLEAPAPSAPTPAWPRSRRPAQAQPPAVAPTVEEPEAEATTRDRRRPPPGSPLVTQIRMSGQHIEIETPEQQREREDLLERLAEDTARWWLGARAGWESLVQRGLRPPDAARDTLKRFPHLLSVPLSRSDEYDDGRLAEGYGILLQRFEKEEPGFVREALTRLNPQLTGRAQDESYPLGEELYRYVVAEGRLYKTFPEFVSDVLTHVLPEPGLWMQGGITEDEDATTLVARPDEPGSQHEDTRTLTNANERFTTHAFNVTTGPLTARLFTLQTRELPVPLELDIRLSEDGTPRDNAWIVVAPLNGKPEKPRKHRAGGTKLEDFGRAHGTVWVAVFNSDPHADKTYQLAITLNRKLPKMQPKFASAASPFKKKR